MNVSIVRRVGDPIFSPRTVWFDVFVDEKRVATIEKDHVVGGWSVTRCSGKILQDEQGNAYFALPEAKKLARQAFSAGDDSTGALGVQEAE